MSDYLKAIQGVIDDLESGNLAGIEDAIAYFRRRLATIAAVENRRAASAAPAEGLDVHAELMAKIEEYGRVRDNIGRSRQANNYAANESAVKRSVDLKFEIDEMLRSALATAPTEPGEEPIPMLLFCPKCGTQHIDAPEVAFGDADDSDSHVAWENPPHRSHLCHACGTIWRPADVATTGVAAIATRGKADTWDGTATAPTMSEAAPLDGAARFEPDMVWPKHDTEQFYHSLDDAVDGALHEDGLAPGQVLTFECAARLPDVRVKIIAVENTDERQSVEWDVERIDRAAAKGESDE
jgi:hypothetical protein